MEIIAELEPTARGAYCGSLGYLGFDGPMDLSILIRTITAGRGWWQCPSAAASWPNPIRSGNTKKPGTRRKECCGHYRLPERQALNRFRFSGPSMMSKKHMKTAAPGGRVS